MELRVGGREIAGFAGNGWYGASGRDAGKRKERPFEIDGGTRAEARREIDGSHAQLSDRCLVSAALLLFEQQFIAEIGVVRPIDENPRVKRGSARRGLRAEIGNEPAS